MQPIKCIEADVRTVNGRIYSADLLRKMVDECRYNVKSRRMLIYPDGDNTGLKDIIGVVVALDFDGKYMQADWESINRTPSTIINAIHPDMIGSYNEGAVDGVISEAKIMRFLLWTDVENKDA